MNIAVLLTTYNRREKTISCLNSLKEQSMSSTISFEIYLTDDNSIDGTVKSILEIFPDAYIYHGNGSLFWAGGMRNSWNEAIKKKFDYFLLLNDDTVLHVNAISVLLETSERVFAKDLKPAICIGSTSDFITREISYGGKKLLSKSYLKSQIVFSKTEILECDLGNANIMLVPKAIVNKIGILSDKFTHGIADYDYTLKAKKSGFGVYVAPGVLGQCTDDHGNNWKSKSTKLTERIKYLKSPKGLAYKEYLYFIRTHFPYYVPFAFFKLWLKTIFPVIWDQFKVKKNQ